MKNYFYIDSAQQQQGPVEASQLLIHGCNKYTFVWTAGMTDWQQAKDVQELSYLFLNQNDTHSSEMSNHPDWTIASRKVENNKNDSNNNTSANSVSEAFLHLLYSILWFAGGGLIVWGLIWLFTDSKGGRIRAIVFVAPFYCAWYGLKELGLFFKLLFKI